MDGVAVKVALIPPIGLISTVKDTKCHMILPEPYRTSKKYQTYARECIGLKILDNGVIEGQQLDPEDLFQIAREVRATEIVAHDVLDECDATIEAVRDFLKVLKLNNLKEGGVMAVVQGRSMAEYLKCLSYFDSEPLITTVGIPRRMIYTLGSKWARVSFVESMEKLGYADRFEIHCLGANSWMREAVCLSETAARSIDTSLPFVMAIANRRIRLEDYVERQENYFDMDVAYDPERAMYGNVSEEVLYGNLFTYRDWARDY